MTKALLLLGHDPQFTVLHNVRIDVHCGTGTDMLKIFLSRDVRFMVYCCENRLKGNGLPTSRGIKSGIARK